MQQSLISLNTEGGPDFVTVYINDVFFSHTLDKQLHCLRIGIETFQAVGLKL